VPRPGCVISGICRWAEPPCPAGRPPARGSDASCELERPSKARCRGRRTSRERRARDGSRRDTGCGDPVQARIVLQRLVAAGKVKRTRDGMKTRRSERPFKAFLGRCLTSNAHGAPGSTTGPTARDRAQATRARLGIAHRLHAHGAPGSTTGPTARGRAGGKGGGREVDLSEARGSRPSRPCRG
jgi:hypothetical protein